MSQRYEQSNVALENAINDMYLEEQANCVHLHGTFELIPGVVQCKKCSKVIRHRSRE